MICSDTLGIASNQSIRNSVIEFRIAERRVPRPNHLSDPPELGILNDGGRLQRVCFLLNVRPERLEEYKARHREVWPEMIRALRDSGWKNYSLFLRPDGLLVGYLETPNFEQALAEMKRRDVNERWQREMAPFFTGHNGGGPDESMVPIEEVFHIDSL
jgi:L-rhamnose mutarotase